MLHLRLAWGSSFVCLALLLGKSAAVTMDLASGVAFRAAHDYRELRRRVGPFDLRASLCRGGAAQGSSVSLASPSCILIFCAG